MDLYFELEKETSNVGISWKLSHSVSGMSILEPTDKKNLNFFMHGGTKGSISTFLGGSQEMELLK